MVRTDLLQGAALLPVENRGVDHQSLRKLISEGYEAVTF